MPSSLLVMPSAGVVSVVLPPQDSGSMPPEVDAHTMFMLSEYVVMSWNLCRETDWHVLLVLPCSQVVHCMAWHGILVAPMAHSKIPSGLAYQQLVFEP